MVENQCSTRIIYFIKVYYYYFINKNNFSETFFFYLLLSTGKKSYLCPVKVTQKLYM